MRFCVYKHHIYLWDISEWRSPGPLAGSILLSDDDPNASPPGKDGWRQLRTLQYYKLPNHAIVAVLPKSRESFSYSSMYPDKLKFK